MVRVGLVSPYSYTYPGGVGRHVEALADELIREGHDVRLLAEPPHQPLHLLLPRRPAPLQPAAGSDRGLPRRALDRRALLRWAVPADPERGRSQARARGAEAGSVRGRRAPAALRRPCRG